MYAFKTYLSDYLIRVHSGADKWWTLGGVDEWNQLIDEVAAMSPVAYPDIQTDDLCVILGVGLYSGAGAFGNQRRPFFWFSSNPYLIAQIADEEGEICLVKVLIDGQESATMIQRMDGYGAYLDVSEDGEFTPEALAEAKSVKVIMPLCAGNRLFEFTMAGSKAAISQVNCGESQI